MKHQQSKSDSAPEHMTKGDLVERIVAEMHSDPDVLVQSKVKLPSRSNARRKREIDVLVTGTILGRAIPLAFECKNYGKKITVGQIDEFKGKLEDVGIPPQCGIYVSALGFTADARDRAATYGIQLLTVDGLAPDRLATEVREAFQSLIFLLLTVTKVTFTNEAPHPTTGELMFLRDAQGNLQGTVFDVIWAKWRDGQLSRELGDHDIDVQMPSGWQWMIDGQSMPTTVRATFNVTGYIVTFPGQAEQIALRDADTHNVQRLRVNASFPTPSGTLPVTKVGSEDELAAALKKPDAVHLTSNRIPLPRIKYNVYWPPSDRVIRALKVRALELMREGKPFENLSDIPFAELEGTDIATIWEPIASVHPASQQEQWPWTRRRRARTQPPKARRRTRSASITDTLDTD